MAILHRSYDWQIESFLVELTKSKKVLIIYSHPKEGSFCQALKESLVEGLKKYQTELRIHNLYKEGFDPLLSDIEENNENEVTVRMKQNGIWA